MSTGRDLIYASLREIGAYGSEDTPDAASVNDALAALNRMWQGWNADLGVVNAETLDSLLLVPGQTSYTIGATGDFAVARPVQIKAAQLRYASNVDLPVEIVSFDRYQEYANKVSAADIIIYMAYNATFPNGTIYVWPQPSAAYTLRLTSLKPLANFDLDSTITLPQGYEDAVVYNLAVRLSAQFGRSLSQTTYALAQESKAVIMRANTVIEEMELDPAMPGQKRMHRFSWRIG